MSTMKTPNTPNSLGDKLIEAMLKFKQAVKEPKEPKVKKETKKNDRKAKI